MKREKVHLALDWKGTFALDQQSFALYVRCLSWRIHWTQWIQPWNYLFVIWWDLLAWLCHVK